MRSETPKLARDPFFPTQKHLNKELQVFCSRGLGGGGWRGGESVRGGGRGGGPCGVGGWRGGTEGGEWGARGGGVGAYRANNICSFL